MGERLQAVPVILAAAALPLAGCSSAPKAPEVVYEHHWTYGPGYGRTEDEGHPLFLDTFNARRGGTWTLNVTSAVAEGTFEIHVRDPDGVVRATWAENGTTTFPGSVGAWNIEIVTDADAGKTPTGRIDLWIRG